MDLVTDHPEDQVSLELVLMCGHKSIGTGVSDFSQQTLP
jgi:hypothetical protein